MSHSKTQRILVVGATSAIAQAAIRIWAKKKARIFLVGRNPKHLEILAADVTARGGLAKVAVLDDVSDLATSLRVVKAAWAAWDGLDGALIAHGWLPEQEPIKNDPTSVTHVLRVNGESVCQMLTMLAERFEGQKKGWLAAISSVAADRGRGGIYVYGAAKAMVSHYLSGLRQRLLPAHVRVIDIHPGPVATPMTEGLKMPLMADAETVAQRMVEACAKANGMVYLPWFWKYIMMILTHIPERVWVKMKI